MKVGEQFEGKSTVFFFDIRGKTVQLLADQGEEKRMTSQEYLNQLQKYLKKLLQSDYEDAMEYFTEYFADAGPEWNIACRTVF